MIDLLAPGVAGLREADVQADHSAPDMREDAVEDASVVLVNPRCRKVRIMRPLCEVPSRIAT